MNDEQGLIVCNDEQEKWVLDYLTSGKGIIPYQMMTNIDSLKLTPKDDFFDKKDFYSTLKEKNISDQQYEDVKKLFKLLRLKTLGDMNRIYNIPHMHEIFLQRCCMKWVPGDPLKEMIN